MNFLRAQVESTLSINEVFSDDQLRDLQQSVGDCNSRLVQRLATALLAYQTAPDLEDQEKDDLWMRLVAAEREQCWQEKLRIAAAADLSLARSAVMMCLRDIAAERLSRGDLPDRAVANLIKKLDEAIK